MRFHSIDFNARVNGHYTIFVGIGYGRFVVVEHVDASAESKDRVSVLFGRRHIDRR